MDDIARSIRALGYVASTRELLVRGHNPDAIYAAVLARSIVRPRKGWYAAPDVGGAAIRALRVGGRLACVDAAVHHHLWVPDVDGLHVAVPRRASRLRTPDNHRERLVDHPDADVIVHWTRDDSPGDRVAVSVAECVRQAFSCRGSIVGFVLLESALHRRRLSGDDAANLIATLPAADRALAVRASVASESGTESLVKLQLIRLQLQFRQQILVPGVGRVDFLIGEKLLIEIDSKEHHADVYRDRNRDALLGARGFRVLRFMYSQIVFEWPVVEAAILAAIARGDHLG